jgi:hypothetical protein
MAGAYPPILRGQGGADNSIKFKLLIDTDEHLMENHDKH